MTVAELIKRLEEMAPESPVYFWEGQMGHMPVTLLEEFPQDDSNIPGVVLSYD